jgi:hypothetical protein
MRRTLLPKKYNTPSDLGGTHTSIFNTRHGGLFWVTTEGGSPGDRSRGHSIRHGRTTSLTPWGLDSKDACGS